MAIDPSISLQVQPLKLPDIGRSMELAMLATQLRGAQRAERNRNALAQVMMQAGMFDERTGAPTTQGLQKISSIDPEMGIQMRQHSLDTLEKVSRIRASEATARWREGEIQHQIQVDANNLLDRHARAAYDIYSTNLPKLGERASTALANEYWSNDAFPDLEKSGKFTDPQRIPRSFDPIRTLGFVANWAEYKRQLEAQRGAAGKPQREQVMTPQGPRYAWTYPPDETTPTGRTVVTGDVPPPPPAVTSTLIESGGGGPPMGQVVSTLPPKSTQTRAGDSGKTYAMTPTGIAYESTPEGKWKRIPAEQIPVQTGKQGSRLTITDATRNRLVRGEVNNTLTRLDSIEKEFGKGQAAASPAVFEHSRSAAGAVYKMIIQAGLSQRQQDIDAEFTALLDSVTAVLSGGLRASDSYREFVADNLPKMSEKPEVRARKLKNLRDIVNGVGTEFGALRARFVNDPKMHGHEGAGGGRTDLPLPTPEALQELTAVSGAGIGGEEGDADAERPWRKRR